MPAESLHLLIKPASGACNMRCGYCFYANLAACGAPTGKIMTEETAERVITRAAETGARRICFAFQGGEPLLMGEEFYRTLVRLQRRYARPGAIIQNFVQTNATLFTPSLANITHLGVVEFCKIPSPASLI